MRLKAEAEKVKQMAQILRLIDEAEAMGISGPFERAVPTAQQPSGSRPAEPPPADRAEAQRASGHVTREFERRGMEPQEGLSFSANPKQLTRK